MAILIWKGVTQLHLRRTIAYVSKQKRRRKVDDSIPAINSHKPTESSEQYPRPSQSRKPSKGSIPLQPPPPLNISKLLDNVLDRPSPGVPLSLTNTSVLNQLYEHSECSTPDYYGLDIPYATNDSPLATRKQEIRGVYSSFVEYMYSRGLIQLTPLLYSCPYFSAFYYPSWHFLSSGRKSRPSLVCLFSKGKENNGEVYPTGKLSPNSFKRSKNPINYAVWRNYINRSYKEALFESFSKILPSSRIPPDGVFLIRATKVMTDRDILQKHMDQVVKKAEDMTSSKRSSEWVNSANSKVDYKRFNQILRVKFLPPVRKLSRGDN